MANDEAPDLAHVVLRPIKATDAQRVHEWASEKRACRFQQWGPNTPEETAAFVAEAADLWADPEGLRLVWAAESSTAGVVGTGEIKRIGASCREIAYAVHVEHWGRGLGTRIARLLVDMSFADAAVERVQATCDPRNHASAAVLRHVGLVVEVSRVRISGRDV